MRSLLLPLIAAALLFDVVSAQSNSTKSGCEVCAATGDCSRAYIGEEGQLCGHWLDRQNDRRPCCCPVHVVCKVSNYACNCGYARGADQYDEDSRSLVWLWWLFGLLALALCCCGCCCFLASKRPNEPNTAIPVAAPVVTGGTSNQPYGDSATTYASAPPEPGYANATPVYGRYYGQSTGRRGGMSAGTGAALGGTAGLLGGVLLGQTLADHGGDAGGGYYDGGGFDGGGGGFDGGGGDFGGDF
ncbi:uncharacterized protein IUM83_17623 [Phytophthora cinnamomi]|uniref:uncharacterized protein n=1 Tax=Phytophthora cinnamomi TaxID=4785 RepID=UPI00355A6F3B|nr:hypothetical protein IUM83_17623 [Phytophthora cinnamomi]